MRNVIEAAVVAGLENGLVKILVNLHHEGVDVPDFLRKSGDLIPFNISQDFANPPEVNTAGITATLRFGSQGFQTIVAPWGSIIQARMGDVVVAQPPSIGTKRAAESAAMEKTEPVRRGHLTLIK